MESNETQHEPEVLVVLHPATASDSLATLKSRYRVTSVLPPRLAVLSAGANVEAVSSLPGVEAVLTQSSDQLPPSLNEPERLFVSAWRARLQADRKTRVGDGLAWDSPGFSPPDRPRRK